MTLAQQIHLLWRAMDTIQSLAESQLVLAQLADLYEEDDEIAKASRARIAIEWLYNREVEYPLNADGTYAPHAPSESDDLRSGWFCDMTARRNYWHPDMFTQKFSEHAGKVRKELPGVRKDGMTFINVAVRSGRMFASPDRHDEISGFAHPRILKDWIETGVIAKRMLSELYPDEQLAG